MDLLYKCVIGIVMLVRVYATQTPYTAGVCGDHPVDIVFLVDTSSSIWKPDFERQLRFVRDVSLQFDIGFGSKQTRIGVLSFANTYYLQFHLWQNNRQDLLERALQRIRHRAGRVTNTGAALRYMRKFMFTHRYGSRSYATHVAVVITDGRSQDRKSTIAAAEALRKHGTDIFSIGVGNEVDYRELEAIASRPTDEYVYEVNDFSSLDAMKFVLANKTCAAGQPKLKTTAKPTTTTTTTGAPMTPLATPATVRETTTVQPDGVQADIDPRLNVTNCGGKPADIYFALDASNSIWPEDFKKQLSFVRDLVSLFDVSEQKTRVGMVTFSDHVKPIFGFDFTQDKTLLMQAISNVTFMSGRTVTSEALKFLREQGFSPDVARREVAHIILTFTDGLSKNPRDTAREAELARRDGIYVFAIGVGMGVEESELKDIASDPDDDFLFHVSSFSVLNTIKDILAIKTCAIQPRDYRLDEPVSACTTDQKTDLLFVYDSAQLGMRNTKRITRFVYDVTSGLDTNSGNLKIGRLTENCLTGADVYLTSQKQAMDFDDVYFPDFRRMIRKLASTGFSEQYGARKRAKKVAVLFIDKDTENLKQAALEMARLRETHAYVVTIGDLDMRTAAAFASTPPNDHVVHIPSYKYLTEARSTLLQKLCKVLSANEPVI